MEERREERVEEDNIEDMTRDFGVEAFCQARVYEIMSVNAETPLYIGSTKFTRLLSILRLMNVKATNGWTDKSLTKLLVLLNEILPEGTTLPTQNYNAKKILCLTGIKYKRIHACCNDCILYGKNLKIWRNVQSAGHHGTSRKETVKIMVK